MKLAEPGRQAGGLTAAALPPPPVVAALPPGIVRPFFSVMIPVYNCPPHYLRETLLSVLAQDPGPTEMQIEVLDNCSTDFDPAALVEEVGGGRVAFHRQPRNVGIVENFNECINRARGHWIHILHGDDTVRGDFYQSARDGAEQHPEIGAVLCRSIYIDEDGLWQGLTELEARTPGVLPDEFAERQLLEQRIQFVGVLVRRATYEELGGFHASLLHCLDWDMWKRLVVRKRIYYNPEPVACYRLHANADSDQWIQTGRNVIDERRSIEISCARDVVPGRRVAFRRAARKAAGVRAARRALLLWKTRRHAAARQQAVEALHCSRAPAVLARIAYFIIRTAVG
ncbi:MAG: glycosyltransferase [Lysobacterales bacterium]